MSLAIREHKIPNHPATAQSLNNLGNLLVFSDPPECVPRGRSVHTVRTACHVCEVNTA